MPRVVSHVWLLSCFWSSPVRQHLPVVQSYFRVAFGEFVHSNPDLIRGSTPGDLLGIIRISNMLSGGTDAAGPQTNLDCTVPENATLQLPTLTHPSPKDHSPPSDRMSLGRCPWHMGSSWGGLSPEGASCFYFVTYWQRCHWTQVPDKTSGAT